MAAAGPAERHRGKPTLRSRAWERAMVWNQGPIQRRTLGKVDIWVRGEHPGRAARVLKGSPAVWAPAVPVRVAVWAPVGPEAGWVRAVLEREEAAAGVDKGTVAALITYRCGDCLRL